MMNSAAKSTSGPVEPTRPIPFDPLRRWLTRRLPTADERRLVVLTGARQTGKTTLARHVYGDLRYLNLDDLELRRSLREVRTQAWARTVGRAVLDEAQKEPSVFDKVKYAFDAREIDFGVLLGSSRILLLKKVRESLAGRASLFDLWPLTLSELTAEGDELEEPLFQRLVDSSGPVGSVLDAEPEILLGDAEERRRRALDHLVAWGGMPALIHLDKEEDRRLWLRSYQQTYLERDLVDLVRLEDLHPFQKLQTLAMLRSGQILSYAKLARDAQIGTSTARRYLEYLDLTYQIVRLQPYYRNLTSQVIKSPKLYWTDLGLLRQGTGQWGPLDGALFETLVVAEIVKWLSTIASDTRPFYYRTRGGLEIDLLLQTPAGVIGLEIKNREEVSGQDTTPMQQVGEALGEEWRGGIVVHRGGHVRPLDPEGRYWGVPVHRLFS